MSSVGVSVADLHFAYPDGRAALNGVTFNVEAGERLAVLGPNGAGKTTLALHLNGLLRAHRGTIRIGDLELGDETLPEIRRRVGLVFQDPDRQVFAASVRAEVEFGPRNLGRRGRELAASVAEALDLTGLGDELRTNPYDLGVSRRKLLALASVLAMRTPIVVLDEPTTGQDARGTQRIRTIVERLAAEGRTVIAISHDMRFVAETFERVAVLRAGRLILDDDPHRVFSHDAWDALRSSYLEPPLPARVGHRLGLGATPTEAALVEQMAQ